MTSENKKAVINVSDSIPIVTSQQVPIGGAVPTGTTTTAVVGTQAIEYRDAGIILTVTPRIGERGTVALDVKQEVNDIGDPEPPTQSRRIIKREAETSVVLLNNQTLVLGGLILMPILLGMPAFAQFKDPMMQPVAGGGVQQKYRQKEQDEMEAVKEHSRKPARSGCRAATSDPPRLSGHE